MFDKKTLAKNIGLNLKRLRLEQNLTMQSLANLADIEKSQIVRIETGKVDAKASSLYNLALALKIDIKELFELEKFPPDKTLK
ncbi:helix-turn-helix domain-containing protein [Mucilaginibacter sp. SP1R1]|uniref:helix-turn-helix domain-containing protein n=1 Tax=Mucilaginibacter sp. SP1R1 TaxID=2723091 RepID=UPI001616FF88|nr:helix-turn-helix transcriptional regulator [Mucilaginibacter sp. SP1R1]MBB6147466.1 transcriptional regulator with XRE-family HTH domain [Mucilaginibacter sp. SP1R1]